mgnify:CR=1 FL=1
MALRDDTTSTKPKRERSPKKTPSTPVSSGPDSATLETIQSLQRQIAELEAKDTANGELTKAQTAKLEALEVELTALKASKASPSPGNVSGTEQETQPSKPAGRMAPWCPW